jgi:hypothetical protein
MLYIMQKELDINNSKILFDEPITAGNFERICKVYSAEWSVEGGWLTGKNPGNFPGMVFLKGDYPGNVLVEFETRTVPPCTHDINFMWNGCWDETKNERGLAYVAGVQGWWEGKVGIEKSPEYKLNAGTPLFSFEPGRIYNIMGGSVDGHCFIFVDGILALEVTDPDPIDSQKFTKVGFEAYCSHIQIRNIKVRSISWRKRELKYTPEF